MERLKLRINLQFDLPIRPWNEMRSLIWAAEGREEAQIQGQAFTTLRGETKERITTQVRAINVEEERDDLAAALARIDALNAVSPLPEVTVVRLDAALIEPSELPFADLVTALRSTLLVPGPWAEGTTDLQVVVDKQVSDTVTEHLQIGPMAPAQMNADLLAFRREDLPEQFVFLGVARTIRDRFAYSHDHLRTLCDGFEAFAFDRANRVLEQLRG